MCRSAIDIDPRLFRLAVGQEHAASRMYPSAAVIISNEKNVYTQIGFENAVAAKTPVFARFRESGKTLGGRAASMR